MNKELIEKFEIFKESLKTKRPDNIKLEELDDYIKKIKEELLYIQEDLLYIQEELRNKKNVILY